LSEQAARPPYPPGAAAQELRAERSGSGNLTGIGMMLLAVLMFSLNDVLGKWLVSTYSVGQILLIRSIAALLILAPFVIRTGWAPFRNAPHPVLQVLRVVFSTLEVASFYWAVSYLPLADVMAYYLAAPIYVTALSALILREKVGRVRWAAVLLGFIGVLVVLRPSADTFSIGSLVAIFGSVVFAFLMIATRYLRGTPNTVLVTTQMSGSLIFGAVAAPLSWVAPTAPDLALMAVLGVVALGAIALVNASLLVAPASVVVPYQYTLIVWAILFGYWVFGDRPEIGMLAGSAIIVTSGLLIFIREQQIARRTAAAPSA
jgi:drug/metabolite transporter (DMT)-like permease